MFSGYNLKIDDSFFDEINDTNCFNCYKDIGENHLNKKFAAYKSNLEKYINNGIINGSKIQEDWFPNINADIFISHSHNDKDLANALAGWLNYNFKLNVFIDSNVWGYSDKLLKSINSRYSNKRENPYGGYLYDHKACNYASQHVNLMLSIALQKMIDEVECVILLNTDNSVTVFDDIYDRFDETYSPWIYSEIICTQIIRKKPLLCYRSYPKLTPANESTNFMSELKVAYKISLDHLCSLTIEDLHNWKNGIYSSEYKKYPLDALYSIKHPKELENNKQIAAYCKYDQEQWKSYFDGNMTPELESKIYIDKLCKCKDFIQGNCPFMNDRRTCCEQ